MTSQPGILRFVVGIGEEKPSMSIKRRWRIAIAILGAAGYVAGTPALPQASRDSEEVVPATPRRYFMKGVTAKTSHAQRGLRAAIMM